MIKFIKWVPGFDNIYRVDAIKLSLIGIYLLCDYPAVLDRVEELGASPLIVVYLGLYISLAMALFAVAFVPQTLARVLASVLLSAASIGLYSYEWATASPFDYVSFEIMLASSGDVGDAAAQHATTLLQATAASMPLFLGLLLPPHKRGLPFKSHWFAPATALLGISLLLYSRGGEGARGLPAAFAPVAYAGIKASVMLSDEMVKREPVTFAKPSKTPTHDIVMIVDESIAPQYLDINHPDGVYSGIKTEYPNLDVVNYGIAASITNCSAGSNNSLRFGGTRRNYFSLSRTAPSIWAYAHAAGYRTVYLDGQRSRGKLQNMATPQERLEIEDFVQLNGMPVIQRDQQLARLLVERINNAEPEFIYVNKVGAHFPVNDKFPDSYGHFRPLPERGTMSNIIDMGPSHGPHQGTSHEWRLYRNAYRNTLMWSVGSFFDYLLPRIAPANAVIIYTSDHGQDLHERGQPGKTTHCIGDPLAEEGAVPLVVLDDASAGRLPWRSHLATTFNAQSHFRIFPTLLTLMGYRSEEIEPIYGPTLVIGERDEMSFTPDYFPALGREPRWLPITVQHLASPPRSDYAPLGAD